MKEEFNLSEKVVFNPNGINWISENNAKEFIKRRIERIKMVIKLYPHKHGEELAGQLIEDLINDVGDDLI